MTTSTAASTAASSTRSDSAGLLRVALKLDAAVTGVNGVAYLVAAPALDHLLGLPTGPLRGVGVFLLTYAVAVWAVSRRRSISTSAVAAVIAANLLWVIDSVVVALVDWSTPTTVGTAWILLQAVVVGAFAALQGAGLRRRRSS